MPKEFYTEKDIEDLFKGGVMSLEVNDNVVLTELAYEKAGRLGMQLRRSQPDNPPSAPVRPYLSQKQAQPPPALAPVSERLARPELQSPAHAAPGETADLQQRIRTAVIARLGTTVDPQLLDVIIQRVLKSTGAK
ncbi:MAG: hypothetical protein ABSB41_03180 [Anaerolineales bacterium]|jgi:hypothetical protein